MTALFAEGIADYSNYGVAGALLIAVAGFIAYIKARDQQDREERKQISEALHGVIDKLALKVEAMSVTLTTAFTSEMAAERASHRQDLTQIGQLAHDLRGMASEAVNAKELSKELSKRFNEQNKGQ